MKYILTSFNTNMTLQYILWLIGLFVLHRGTYGAYEESMLDRLTESCPYLSTCSRIANLKFPVSPDYTPCCRQCSCDENCHEINNCCPEVSENSTSVPENLVRKHGECISTAYPDQGGNGYKTSAMFFAVTSCPKGYQDTHVAQQCADTTPEDIQQVAFVSDKEGTVYRNIYCAQCHDAPNPQRWLVMFTCGQAYGANTFELSLSNIVQRECALLSQPPHNSPGLLEKRCFKPDVTECNVTGRWDVFDPVLERSCSTESVLFMRRKKVFKNVFCFFCNNPKSIQHKTHSCKDLAVLPKIRFTYYPFSAVLDPSPNVQNKIPPTRDTKGCKFNEIYDSNTDVCRELHCPPGDVISDGKCEKAFLQTDSFNVKRFFKIQAQGSLLRMATYDDTEKILNGAHYHVIRNLKRKLCRFCHFSAFILYLSKPGTYFLRQILQTSPTCPVSVIIGSAEAVDNTSMSVALVGKEMAFTVEHVLYDMDESPYMSTRMAAGEIAVGVDSRCRFVSEGFPASDSVCPYVEISGLDYVKALRSDKLRQTHHYATYNMSAQTDNELANITVGICVADYLQRSSTVGVFVHAHGSMSGGFVWLTIYVLCM